MTEEQKTEEKHEHHKHEEHAEHEKKPEEHPKVGRDKKQALENASFLIIVISSAMFIAGIGLGSYIQGTILLSILGSFFAMIGIVIYMATQFIEVKNG